MRDYVRSAWVMLAIVSLVGCGGGAPPAVAPAEDKAYDNVIAELEKLQPADLGTLKGEPLEASPDAPPDPTAAKIYACKLPLTGFKTTVEEHPGGAPSVRAVANRTAPLPPEMRRLLNSEGVIVDSRGARVEDSLTDAALRRRLGKRFKRIIILMPTRGGTSIEFDEGAAGDGYYEIVLAHVEPQ